MKPDSRETTKAVKKAKEASENTSAAQDEALFAIAQRSGGGCAITGANTAGAIFVNAADGSHLVVHENGATENA